MVFLCDGKSVFDFFLNCFVNLMVYLFKIWINNWLICGLGVEINMLLWIFL